MIEQTYSAVTVKSENKANLGAVHSLEGQNRPGHAVKASAAGSEEERGPRGIVKGLRGLC